MHVRLRSDVYRYLHYVYEQATRFGYVSSAWPASSDDWEGLELLIFNQRTPSHHDLWQPGSSICPQANVANILY